MISRKSARLLADAYDKEFSHTESSFGFEGTMYTHIFDAERIYDFLYEKNYEAWFMNAVKKLSKHDSRHLKEFLMQVHTGESLIFATSDWSGEERKKLGQQHLKNLAEDIIKRSENTQALFSPSTKNIVDVLKSQLELDGFIYKEGVLYPVESSVIDEKEEQKYLEYLLKKVLLPDIKTVKHHVGLAEEHYLNSNWDDSISNSRKFLEAILQQVANGVSLKKYGKNLSKDKLERPASIREFLKDEKLIEKKEKDAISKIYGLLSDTGAHPYIAERDQARLMRHLALTFSQFVLLRYKGYLKSSNA